MVLLHTMEFITASSVASTTALKTGSIASLRRKEALRSLVPPLLHKPPDSSLKTPGGFVRIYCCQLCRCALVRWEHAVPGASFDAAAVVHQWPQSQSPNLVLCRATWRPLCAGQPECREPSRHARRNSPEQKHRPICLSLYLDLARRRAISRFEIVTDHARATANAAEFNCATPRRIKRCHGVFRRDMKSVDVIQVAIVASHPPRAVPNPDRCQFCSPPSERIVASRVTPQECVLVIVMGVLSSPPS